MKIIGGLLCKNEEHRWLIQYLQQMETLCDDLVVLDDGSTDRTQDMCCLYGAEIHTSHEPMFDKDESELRKRLWNLCAKKAKEDDWIIILDADELINSPQNLRVALKSLGFAHINLLGVTLKSLGFAHINLLGFKLFDMWSDTHYRSDSLWNAHKRAWVMCVRYKFDKYTFNESKLHCGRWPNEIVKQSMEEMHIINDIYIKHMGWSTPEDRQKKYDRYMKLDGEGKFGSLEQYQSILDPNPNLIKL
jgi:glycosyltransferase involved in cell wall biosynthesis